MSLNLITRFRHRRYVKIQGRKDRNMQEKIGLNTFTTDWQSNVKTEFKVENRIPRKVWMLWMQGEDNAPELVKASIASWRQYNPSWEIIVLDENSIEKYIKIPEFPADTSLNHKANIIRLRLLVEYGGVWTDATSLCLKPLNDWIDQVTPEGFFAFSRPQPLRPLANWFIATQPNSAAVTRWLTWSESYLLSRFRPTTYFWSHFTFKWILENYKDVEAIWANTPKIVAKGPHILQRILDGDLDSSNDPADWEMSLLPLLKMNWKKGYSVEQINEELRSRGVESKFLVQS